MATTRSYAKIAVAILLVAAVIASLAIGFFGQRMASADNDSASAQTIGLGAKTTSADSAVGQWGSPETTGSDGTFKQAASESSVYQASTGFDISVAATRTEARIEAERIAAEEATRAAEAEAINQALAAEAEWYGADNRGTGLAGVDWGVGKEEFVSSWGARINDYLAGSPLSGYGEVFAEAAWDNGVDPRWSPAISNTESSKGSVCFLPYNAWGWGQRSFDNWDDAIRAHVKGLASGYGYSITLNYAAIYCPPNYLNWFNNTLSEMQKI